MIGPLIRESGIDVILGVGGAIQGHPDGAEAGTRAIRAQIDEAMALLPPRTSR
jgi:2,3-diketo-5-methylthiopentyl-1-phosphate enolase